MDPSAEIYEKLGRFYLGRHYDVETEQTTDELLLYDSKDLVTHGLVVGMTGSGKTGLCLALLEEAALDHIPAIVVDPKGDLCNLMLLFPELAAADFRPWIHEEDAARKGLSPDDHAAETAATWRAGMADWGQDGGRIRRLREHVDINIFTPGSKAGVPVSMLSSLAVPAAAVLEDEELLGGRIASTVGSLLTWVGVDADPVQSPQALLLAAIFHHAWTRRQGLSLEELVSRVQSPPFDKLGVMDVESFLPAKARQALAMKVNQLLAAPGFAAWLDGPPLDMAAMLHTPAGKPRISIFSIAHLGDAERMFFVSLLAGEMLAWMRAQSGTSSLRALFYMDEIFGYLPPSANPPSKRPLLTMLKQGRAFGLGCLLATQNPVDLDYKALSNIGTWWLGRLPTERDKLRVLDGLEGVAGAQGTGFDRAAMERCLSGLAQRVFLMNNVHEDAPVVFHVRWVMCYLAGPLARNQIKTLMAEKRRAFETSAATTTVAANPMAMPARTTSRPPVAAGVREVFLTTGAEAAGVVYQPYLLRTGRVAFSAAKQGIDFTRDVCLVNPILPEGIDWENPLEVEAGSNNTTAAPEPGVPFAELPGYAMNAANYKQAAKEFADWLYRTQRLTILSCPALKTWSRPDESEGSFRARLLLQAREARDAAIAGLRETAGRKLDTLQTRLQGAEGQLAKQKAEANAAKMQAGMSVLGGLLGGLFGRKGGLLTRGSAAIGKAGRAYTQHQDVTHAEAKVADITADIAEARAALEADVAELTAAYDPAALALESESLKPTKSGVSVESTALLWIPR